MKQPVLCVATRKGLFRVTRDNGSWQVQEPSFLGDNVSAVLHHPVSGLLYAALDHGHFGVKLHRSADGGGRWEEIPVPENPPRPEGEGPLVDFLGRTIPDSLQLIWCLEAGHPSQGRRLWAGTAPGGLFHSDDDGDSWQLTESLWNHPGRRRWMGGGLDSPGIHTILVHPEEPGDITVAVSCGGIWHSPDDGATWENIGQGMTAPYTPPEYAGDPGSQDVHRLARCRGAPDRMWLQHHDGIYRSDDAGRNWRRIRPVLPGDFGFPVVVDEADPDRAWFVPEIKDEHRVPPGGRVVVNRTEDGGQTFTTFHEGLPGPLAYDLVYRHSLDRDAGEGVLAMGSTTGSLWISGDDGVSWESISRHLPPIYALRFD
ncbi:MAG: exo-alpha-sialidase [Gammaproteobacteria bacterium]|nr:exo-alpha-sialidase [Gammaproteobacteria bacterium]MYG66482.1 exo-alpha-sialidase [Gammaproteobacteria bacterium]